MAKRVVTRHAPALLVLTRLAEQVLQVLPTHIERKLHRPVNTTHLDTKNLANQGAEGGNKRWRHRAGGR